MVVIDIGVQAEEIFCALQLLDLLGRVFGRGFIELTHLFLTTPMERVEGVGVLTILVCPDAR